MHPLSNSATDARAGISRWTKPAAEPQLARQERRSRGVYYTPAEIAQYIAQHTLAPLLPCNQAPRILDPACGAGALLVAAYDNLLRSAEQQPHGPVSPEQRVRLLKQSIYGCDLDPQAAADARRVLAETALRAQASDTDVFRVADELAANIVCADALIKLPFELGGFDAVVGNPPYVNIRQLARNQSPEYVARLRQTYTTARGAFDLYVLFIERSLHWLRGGGRFGVIVPNKLGGLDYARACRELLLRETALERVADLSPCRAFAAAGVYPWILVGAKQSPPLDQQVTVHRVAAPADLADNTTAPCIAQRALSAAGFVLTTGSDARTIHATRAKTIPLGELALIECGTAGYRAQQIAAALRERTEDDTEAPGAVEFIVSGNIDPYVIRPGNVRYMQRRFRRPELPLDSPALSSRQRNLFARPKLVLSGMSRRLEAAYDRQGYALGVQVYAITAPADELPFLLALLNSRYLSDWFREQFAAKQLSGGYLAINKGQLIRLPVPVVTAPADRRRQAEIIEQAELLEHWIAQRARLSGGSHAAQLDGQLDGRIAELEIAIDRLVDELYQMPQTLPERRAA